MNEWREMESRLWQGDAEILNKYFYLNAGTKQNKKYSIVCRTCKSYRIVD